MLNLVIFLLIAALSSSYGHNGGTFRDDAILQADLMPQELNPEFRSQVNEPNRNVYADLLQIPELPRRPLLPPKARVRRDVTSGPGPDNAVEPYATSIAEQVKQYSRVIAGFVIVVSLVIEIIVYIVEAYQKEAA